MYVHTSTNKNPETWAKGQDYYYKYFSMTTLDDKSVSFIYVNTKCPTQVQMKSTLNPTIYPAAI